MTADFSSEPTQRAYTLSITGYDRNDESWREKLWQTHMVVNKGAKVFSDWLLTMRGGLCHTLADHRLTHSKPEDSTLTKMEPDELKVRRIVLALSWLSVESELGAPSEEFWVPMSEEPLNGKRKKWKTVEALREILRQRAVSENVIEDWVRDCKTSLEARIRDDAVWVNRSRVFDDYALKFKLNREDVHDMILTKFPGGREKYFKLPDLNKTFPKGKKDFKSTARSFVSKNWGGGVKSDSAEIVENLEKICQLQFEEYVDREKQEFIDAASEALGAKAG
ncbi:hypothetical protein GF339_00960, partial [candidate division KSB3 bacterium]|nr:hypothetical protein [candidate division KSB3 bacterium]MBD3323119.1 hypothetical protein [candidate division KSB3 bacterium]